MTREVLKTRFNQTSTVQLSKGVWALILRHKWHAVVILVFEIKIHALALHHMNELKSLWDILKTFW